MGRFLHRGDDRHVVNGRPPRGYVDDANAAWLIGQVDRDGAPINSAELELVVKVLEKALNCPAPLKAWALRQIEAAVLGGGGSGVIDEAEVRLLRRIIFAGGGDGALVVSADEAEMLWRLKDACLDADNARRLEDPVRPGGRQPSDGLFLLQAARARRGGAARGVRQRSPQQRARLLRADARRQSRRRGAKLLDDAAKPEIDHDGAVAAARAVTPGEESWLQARIDADGARDPL